MRNRTWLGGAFVAALSVPAFAAGDVTVAVDPVTSVLRITGDALDNNIEVTSDGTTGSYTVTGVNGTTVNSGAAAASVTGARAVVVAMGAGSDHVELTGIRIRGNLSVRLDDGDDDLVMTNVILNPRWRAGIRCGTGNDHVIVQGSSQIQGSLVVRGDAGDDDVQFLNSEFLARVRLDLGSGNDGVKIDGCDFEDRSLLQVEARAGEDTLELQSSTFHNDVFADLGRDDDHAILDNSDFSQDVDISGGGGGGDDLSLRAGNDFNRNHVPGFHSFEE